MWLTYSFPALFQSAGVGANAKIASLLTTSPACVLQAYLADPDFMAYVDQVEQAWLEVEQALEGEA